MAQTTLKRPLLERHLTTQQFADITLPLAKKKPPDCSGGFEKK